MPPTNIKQQKPYKSVAGGNAGLKKNTSIPTNKATDEPDRLKKHARAVVTQGQADFYHPLFQESTLMLPTKTREIFQYCRHWYRCLTPDTRVLLSDGTTKEIQNIDKNDTVITENGTASNINEIFKKEIEDDIYLINAKGIQKTICATKQHPFLAIPFEEIKCIKHKKDNTVCKKHLAICKNCSKKDVEFKTRYIHAKDLKINDVILTPVMKGEIECVYTDEWLRLLGYYLAEGCIYKKHGRNIGIRFSISKKERKTLGKNINALCNSIYGKDCYFYDVPRGDSLEVRIYVGNHGVDDVIKHAGEYSHYKTLSQEMMLLPPQKQMIILGSYLDGDGSIDKSTKTIIATTVSKKLVSQMQQICIRNGITARIYQYWNNEVQGWKYILRIPAKFGDIISKYSKCNYNKKKKRIEPTFWVNEFIGKKITKTEKEAYKGLIYNLNVEGDYNSFVADGVIVHNTDPMVAAAINFHAEFCINGFRNICKDERVKKYFDEFAFDIVKLPEFLSFVALEWYKLGQVVPFGIWNEGDGRWDRFITLNPDYVEIEKTLFSDKPLLKLDPDEGLKRIVTNKKPRHLYDQLDPNIIAYVNKGQKIPLSSLVIETEKGDVEFPQVTLLARKASQYEVYGTPMLMSVFKVLIYKDLLRNAQFAIAKRHWKPIKLVKVGDKDHEPTAEILDAVEEAIRAADADSNSWLVWHHYISADYIASAGHVMPLNAEYQWIDQELMRGLEISDAVLTNQGMTFANASVSLRVMVNKYRRFQKMLSSFIKEFVYKPVAEVQGFYETDSEGNKKLIIPDVEWELDKLQDDAQLKQVLQGLQQKGLISKHTLMAHIGVDYDKEKDMIQSESKDDAVFNTKPAAPGQQMTLPVTGQPPAAVPPIGGGGGGGMPPAPKVPGAPPVGGPLPPVGGTPPIGGGGEGTLPPVPGV